MAGKNELTITIDFSGGLQTIFGGLESKEVKLDGKRTWKIRDLLHWVRDNLLCSGEPEMFLTVEEDTVRPGILVVINDMDWALVGELDYELQEKDNVFFLSTLHGG